MRGLGWPAHVLILPASPLGPCCIPLPLVTRCHTHSSPLKEVKHCHHSAFRSKRRTPTTQCTRTYAFQHWQTALRSTHPNVGTTAHSSYLRVPTLATQHTPTYAFQHWQHRAQLLTCLVAGDDGRSFAGQSRSPPIPPGSDS